MKHSNLLLYFFFLSFSFHSFGKKEPDFNYTKEKVNQSILFQRIADGKILYEKEADLPLTPGSVAKVFGAAALLKNFGLNYRIETDFFYSGNFNKGAIEGDLIVVGHGDPKLVNEDLWKIVADFEHMGVKSFSGNLVIDNSFFREIQDDGRVERVAQNSYDAPLAPLSVNFNTYELSLLPGKKVGDKGQVQFYPYPLEGVPIRNYLKTVSSDKKETIQVRRVLEKGKDFIEVSGTIKLSSPLKKIHRSTSQATRLSGETIKAFLKSRGILLKGKIKEGLLKDYKESKKLLSYKGQALSSHVKDFLAYSNNFMTDMLVNVLGASFSDHGDTHEVGMKFVNDFMKTKSFPSKGFYLENASGLSKKSRTTARQMVSFLVSVSKETAIFPDFLAALTSPGAEGSLKHRFQFKSAAPYQKMVRAKTGTLLTPVSVATLVGYLMHPKEGLIAFAVIQNGKKGVKPQANIINLRHATDLGIVDFLRSL